MKIRTEVFFGMTTEEKAVIDRLSQAKIITVIEVGKIVVAGRWGTNKTTLKKISKEA